MSPQRTESQIREHYEIEKELARKLLVAPRDQRRSLYTSLYNELFQRVPHHSQLTQKASPTLASAMVKRQMLFLKPFLRETTVFMEVGPGDCALSLEVARHVRQVYAVDVSDEITKGANHPDNFRLMLSDGCTVPVPPSSIDVVYSNQLMEHLHPDDALMQLNSIYAALKPGGIYICITPNGVNGPHDISAGFDRVATGFHLKEYTLRELGALFKQAGFAKIKTYIGRGRPIRVPQFFLLTLESILQTLPYVASAAIGKNVPVRLLLGRPVIAIKK
jgi:SAM-dependent methyltransferase